MVYILALGAALANALTSILQRMGVEDAPATARLKLSLMTHALRRGIWLMGFVLMALSFVMQATALHFGRLTQVQPVLTTELLFLVLILAFWFHYRVGIREWTGVCVAALGLAGFLEFSSPTGGKLVPTGWGWLLIGLASGSGIAVCVYFAMRGPRWWRAVMFGAGAAIGYAFTAALTKVVTNYIANDWVSMFWHWETYGLAVTGLIAVFLTQNAYHAGPIAASQSTLVLVDPLASILIGIGLFGDNLRTSGAWGPLDALSLLVMFTGAVWVAQSPLVSGIKGESEAHDEMLSRRSRSRSAQEPVVPPAISS